MSEALRPITLGGFVLTSTGIEIDGRPTYQDYVGALAFAMGAHEASGWWIADILRYGSTREDWAERLSQAQAVTGLSRKTLENVRAIGAIDKSRRREDVEFSVHGEVASLKPAEQTRWLDKAAEHGWTVRELRQAIHASRRATSYEGRAEEMFTVDVTVQVEIEARTSTHAQDASWELVKHALTSQGIKAAKVIGARARPR